MLKYEELRAFKEQHGHTNVPCKYKLRLWIKQQRRRWNTSSLEERESLLKLGFDPDPLETLWQRKQEELRAYAEVHGHCNVKRAENSTLSNYLKEIRWAYHKGKLAQDRIAALEKLGIIWGGSRDRLFEDTYHKMIAYRLEYGCLSIPNTCSREHKNLAVRMGNLRKAYYAGNLSDEKIRRLKELEFSFEPDDERWQKRYHELTEYVSKGGNPNRIPNKNLLRGWIRGQKASYQNGAMPQEKIELLEKLGIAWSDMGYLNEMWQNNFRCVADYFEKNGVNILPAAHPVYKWWIFQLKNIHKLPPEKAEKVRSLKPGRSVHRWSEHEKNVVRENPDKNAKELTELLIGRTPQAIRKLRDKYGW